MKVEKKKHAKEIDPQKCIHFVLYPGKLKLTLMLICIKGNQVSTLVIVSVIRHFIAIFKNIAAGILWYCGMFRTYAYFFLTFVFREPEIISYKSTYYLEISS